MLCPPLMHRMVPVPNTVYKHRVMPLPGTVFSFTTYNHRVVALPEVDWKIARNHGSEYSLQTPCDAIARDCIYQLSPRDLQPPCDGTARGRLGKGMMQFTSIV